MQCTVRTSLFLILLIAGSTFAEAPSQDVKKRGLINFIGNRLKGLFNLTNNIRKGLQNNPALKSLAGLVGTTLNTLDINPLEELNKAVNVGGLVARLVIPYVKDKADFVQDTCQDKCEDIVGLLGPIAKLAAPKGCKTACNFAENLIRNKATAAIEDISDKFQNATGITG